MCAERVVRFLVAFTSARHPGTEEEADDFAEAFLGFLLNLATAKDKAVRFRVCQIVAGVLNALGPDAEVSDDLYERMEVRSGPRGNLIDSTNSKLYLNITNEMKKR